MQSQTLSMDGFEELLAPVLDTAYRVALRYTRNADDAADLVQDTLVRAIKSRHTFEPGSNFRAWFLKILTHHWWRAAVKKSNQTTVPLSDAPEIYIFVECEKAGMNIETTDPVRVVLGRLDAERIGQALDSLPDDYREATALHLIESLSYQEISDILQVPLGTVRSRIHRGRNLLQRSLWSLYNE